MRFRNSDRPRCRPRLGSDAAGRVVAIQNGTARAGRAGISRRRPGRPATRHRSDVGRVLAASDFFVLTSQREGLPFSVLEAMAMGSPRSCPISPRRRGGRRGGHHRAAGRQRRARRGVPSSSDEPGGARGARRAGSGARRPSLPCTTRSSQSITPRDRLSRGAPSRPDCAAQSAPSAGAMEQVECPGRNPTRSAMAPECAKGRTG
jgi:Glycosyl transferases group 1